MSGRRVGLEIVVLLGIAAMMVASPNVAAAPQFSDWSAPISLGPVVNSVSDESQPAISKDGLSLYFGSSRSGGSGQNDIWVAQRPSADDPWGPPVNLGPTINTDVRDDGPALSRDEHWLFFNSNRPGGFGAADILASYREQVHDDFGWQAPVNLGPGVNSPFLDQGAGYFENDEAGVPLLYFGSNRPGGVGGGDIYVSAQLPDGLWGAAELVPELSSPAGDFRPIPRFDGLEIFLFSDRTGGFGGYDMWVSRRDAVSDPWEAPANLGATLNGPQNDWQAYLASNRETLYFASNRPGGLGGIDLYVTTRARQPGGSP